MAEVYFTYIGFTSSSSLVVLALHATNNELVTMEMDAALAILSWCDGSFSLWGGVSWQSGSLINITDDHACVEKDIANLERNVWLSHGAYHCHI